MLEIKNICLTRDNKKILENINLKKNTHKYIVITVQKRSRKI